MLILRVWKDQPGKYFCISTKDRSGKWGDHFFTRSQFSRVKAFIEDNKDKDLYWCPHGFTTGRRLKKYAEVPKLLWADLDEANPRDIQPMPSIAWESSPGRYVGLWLMDKFITEELNQRLTYAVGADKGGWDFTQVLRVPGTNNYKYRSTPRVKMLWSDGPSYKITEIQKLLPAARKTPSSTSPVTKIYKKYEKNFSGFVRRELLRGKPRRGKRSEVLWKLVHELIEAGCSQDEAFELLRASPWNKFKTRRDGDEQLRRELDKALNRHLHVVDDEEGGEVFEESEVEDDDDEPYKFLSHSMDQVEEENVDWVWYPYIARGELTILEGDPGLGKSYLAQMISRDICDGRKLPCVKRLKAVRGKVAYFDIENSMGSVTKKRLVSNGCQNLENFFQEEEPFTIDDEDTLDDVYEAIEHLRPALVVFDTLNTYIGKADTYKSSEVTQAFRSFLDIARRFNCSVMVLRHLTKGTKERALYRGQGSIAFSGLARVVITVGRSPDDDNTRVMAVTKINVTRPPKALTFTIEELPDTLKDQDRSKFTWGDFVDLTSDDIISVVEKKTKDNSDQVEAFILDILDNGPMDSTKVKRSAAARSIGTKSLYRVADEMGIVKKTAGFGKKKSTLWALPK